MVQNPSLNSIQFSSHKEVSKDGIQPHSRTTRNSSHKAIHYERQTQLRFKHTFDITPLYQQLPHWCSQVDGPGVFTLTFEFTLPCRRKIKRGTDVFDLTSTKEYEAAQAGLMHARCMFDIFAGEHYTYGCSISLWKFEQSM